VIIFGSLAHGAWFHPRSDIDLAVEGLAPESFWRAGSALDHLEPAFEIDLIAFEAAPPELAQEIAQGQEL
jgi:predicted nucleotidyltransferase